MYASDTTAPYEYGTMATITCITGFGVSGTATRTCSGDGLSTTGVWEGNIGSCVRECSCIWRL